MYQVKLDNTKKLLTIIYAQKVSPDETKRCLAELETVLENQKGGFCLLTDLSGLESMDLACVPDIRRAMDLLNKKGVERVVRVIPDPRKDIGFNILSLFHYRRGVRIITCETMDEAMTALRE